MRALVMMPNCPKPPRTAKKSSDCPLAEQGTISPLPVTTSSSSTLLQRGLQHMHPKLPAACFHERECASLVPVWHHLYNPLHCGHLDHDSLVRLQQWHASCQAAISRTTVLTYQFKHNKPLMIISGIQQKRNRDILGIVH
jgi:hypothetical protein